MGGFSLKVAWKTSPTHFLTKECENERSHKAFHGTEYILPMEAERQLLAQIQAQSCILLYSGRPK